MLLVEGTMLEDRSVGGLLFIRETIWEGLVEMCQRARGVGQW